MGWVYLLGRDKQFRPVICWNCHLIDTNHVNIDDIIKAICRLFIICESQMFYNGRIENWYCLVETNDRYEGVQFGVINFIWKII